MRKHPQIHTRSLLTGCELCLKNADAFAEEADLLLQNNFQDHAFALVILGFQELGKFGQLLENFVSATHANAKQVTVNDFTNHKFKMKARMEHYRAVEEELRTDADFTKPRKLTKDERYWKRIFESRSFAKTVQMLEKNGEGERLAATYVDYDPVAHTWIPPHSPRKEFVEAHRRLLLTEVMEMGLALHVKSPDVALMVWKAQRLND